MNSGNSPLSIVDGPLNIIYVLKNRLIRYFYTILIVFLFSCGSSDTSKDNDKKNDTASLLPQSISYHVVNTFPHDTSSFTEGLLIDQGKLYESTGEKRRSHLLSVDLATGKIERKHALDSIYFGEGIAILHDTVYQLTWQQNTVFVYTLKDFKKVKQFKFDKEGWGLTHDGKSLIASDGGSNLYYYDPIDFHLIKTLAVTEGENPSFNLNELEYIDGYIYANQWQYPYILKIDPAGGKVVGKIDLSKLCDNIKKNGGQTDVLNGIAYDKDAKKIYVTGKWWPALYEIQLGF